MISKTSFSGQIQDCWNYEKAPYSQHKIRFLKITVCNMLDKQIKNEINYFITLIILRQNSSEYHSVNRPKWGHSELILSSWLGFLTWSIIFSATSSKSWKYEAPTHMRSKGHFEGDQRYSWLFMKVQGVIKKFLNNKLPWRFLPFLVLLYDHFFRFWPDDLVVSVS